MIVLRQLASVIHQVPGWSYTVSCPLMDLEQLTRCLSPQLTASRQESI